MQRIPALDPATLTGRGQELAQGIQAKMGMVPNIYRAMVHSPAVLEAVQSLNAALDRGVLRRGAQELLAVYVGELNGCHYCVSAHSMSAKGLKIPDEEVLAARRGQSADPKMAAMLRLARSIMETRGKVPDEELSQARSAGLNDAEIVEVCANVARNIYTNYFNNLAQSQLDLPPAPPLA